MVCLFRACVVESGFMRCGPLLHGVQLVTIYIEVGYVIAGRVLIVVQGRLAPGVVLVCQPFLV